MSFNYNETDPKIIKKQKEYNLDKYYDKSNPTACERCKYSSEFNNGGKITVVRFCNDCCLFVCDECLSRDVSPDVVTEIKRTEEIDEFTQPDDFDPHSAMCEIVAKNCPRCSKLDTRYYDIGVDVENILNEEQLAVVYKIITKNYIKMKEKLKQNSNKD